jgi:leader peptidase (prepilin peptidase)/N-methyltransferase
VRAVDAAPHLTDWLLIAIAPVIGSFLGLVVRRLPEAGHVVWGRSRCEHCRSTLAVRDLVPLVSWLIARGRCRRCNHPLGWFYPGVELAAFAIAVLAVVVDPGIPAWLDALLGWWLLTLAWIDLRQWLLPDVLTLPLVVLGLAEAAEFAPGDLIARVAGTLAGYLGFWVVSRLYRRLRGREGLGLGDAKLLAASGAWVGIIALPSVVAGAAAAALIVAGAVICLGTPLDRYSAVPFGPFLAVATWLVWLFGPIAMGYQ